MICDCRFVMGVHTDDTMTSCCLKMGSWREASQPSVLICHDIGLLGSRNVDVRLCNEIINSKNLIKYGKSCKDQSPIAFIDVRVVMEEVDRGRELW